MSGFADPKAISRYAENAAKKVPGLFDLHKMAAILLAERSGQDAEILVLGAGGGMELAAFAKAQSGWRFVGVDPSEPMLDLARESLGELISRVTLITGTIDAAPAREFDGATCLLTLHFLTGPERLATLIALRARLKPGAALVIAHHSFPTDPLAKTLWLNRYAAFGSDTGVATPEDLAGAAAIGERLPILSPDEEIDLLREAGFTDVAQFYAAFSFRGFVAVNKG